MRAIAPISLMLVFLAFVPALAQEKTEVDASRDRMEAEREALIEKNLGLTPDEKKAFWPVYKEYRKEMIKVDDKRVALIRKFAEEYQQLTNEQALAMLSDYFRFRESKVSLQTSFIERFKKVLPGKKVGRYYQVENLIDTQVDFELTRAVPFMK